MWKKIFVESKETAYSVSDNGEVRNDNTNRLLKQQNQNGYCHCTLTIDGHPKRCRVHRLVAEYFVENPDNKPYVNHIDGNRINNKATNLEWVTPSENAQHAVEAGLRQNGRNRPVVQYTMDGTRLLTFQSITQAALETNTLDSKIVLCCQRKRRSANDFQWRYADDKQDVVKIEKKWFAGKKVAQYDINGKLIATYPSYSEAARQINGSNASICTVCAGKAKTHKGFIWKVVDDIVQDEI